MHITEMHKIIDTNIKKQDNISFWFDYPVKNTIFVQSFTQTPYHFHEITKCLPTCICNDAMCRIYF